MMGYRLVLTARGRISPLRRVLTPIFAFAFAFLCAGLIVFMMGRSPYAAFEMFVLAPLTDAFLLQEVVMKATPLVLIAIGLLFPFRANRWNIGAEGQFLFGIMGAGIVALTFHEVEGAWILPLLLLSGAIAGGLYASIPALLRVYFGVSEILTSLMLVYIADLMLDYLVRGPWRDPLGYNFPQSVSFSPSAILEPIFNEGRLNIGFVFALLAVIIAFVLLSRTLFGFAIRASGEAPRAANFAGFKDKSLTLLIFVISGALAGFAGALEAAGSVQQLKPGMGIGLGFTAIIVAFLGRLMPITTLFAGIVMAVLLIGAENAQVALKLPLDLTRFFMGLLLIVLLAGESLERYKLEFKRKKIEVRKSS